MSVDNRVVIMTFENEQFEKNIDKSIGSLERLEESCDFSKIQNSLKNFSTGNMADQIDGLADRFSTMGIVGMTVIQNITDRVTDMSIAFAKSLTTDQIASGFSKYEESTKDIIALMNQSDLALESATGYLDQLSWYSDATSFGFTDMTAALKTFVANGVNLDDSIATIMGIGNSITYAGKSANVGAEIFDMFAKVMGTGYMSLQRWNQLSLRGLGTEKLKQDLIETAATMENATLTLKNGKYYVKGTGVEVNSQTFTTTLAKKWLNTDTLNATFGEKYGEFAQGLQDFITNSDTIMTTNQAIDKYIASIFDVDKVEISYKGQAKKIAAASKSFVESFKKTNAEFKNAVDNKGTISYDTYTAGLDKYIEALKSAGQYTNRTKAIQLYNQTLGVSFNELGYEMLKSASEARTYAEATDAVKDAASTQFKNIFEQIFGNADEARVLWSDFSDAINDFFVTPIAALANGLKKWKELGGRDAMIEVIGNLVSGIGSYLAPLKEAFGEVFNFGTRGFGAWFAELSIKLSLTTKKFKISEKAATALKNVFTILFKVIKAGLKTFNKLVSLAVKIADAFSPLISIFNSIVSLISGLILKIAELATGITEGPFSKIGEFINEGFTKGLLGGIKNVLTAIASWVASIVDSVKEKLGIHSPSTVFYDIAVYCVQGFINGFKTIVKKLPEILKGITDALKQAMEDGTFDEIAAAAREIVDILSGLLELAIVMKLTTIFQNLSAIAKIAVVPTNAIKGTLKSVKYAFDAATNTFRFAKIVEIAAAIGIMTLAIKSLASMGDAQVARGLVYLGSMLLMIGAFIRSLNGVVISKNAVEIMNRLRQFGITLALLSASLLIISLIPTDKLSGAIHGMAACVVGLIFIMKQFKAMDGIKISASVIASVAPVVLILYAIIPVIVAMTLILASLRLAGLSNFEAFATIFGILAIMFASLMGCMVFIKNVSSQIKPGDILGLLATVISIIALMGAITIVFFLLENLQNQLKNAGSIALVIGSIAALMFGLSALINSNRYSGKSKSTSFVTSLLAVAASVAIIAASLILLSTSDPKELGLDLLILVGGMTLLVGSLWAFGALSGTIEKGINLINKFAGSLLKFTLTIMAAPAIIALFVLALSTVGAGTGAALKYLLKIMADAAPDIANAIHAIVTACMNMLLVDFPLLCMTILGLAYDVIVTIGALVGIVAAYLFEYTDEIVIWIVEWVIKLLYSLLVAIDKNAVRIAKVIYAIVAEFLKIAALVVIEGMRLISQLFWGLFGKLFNISQEDVNAPFDKMEEYVGNWFAIDNEDIISSVTPAIDTADKTLTGGMSNIGDNLVNTSSSIMSQIGGVFSDSKFFTGANDTFTALSGTFGSFLDGITDKANGATGALNGTYDAFNNLVGDNVKNGLENTKDGITNMGDVISKLAEDVANDVEDDPVIIKVECDTSEAEVSMRDLNKQMTDAFSKYSGVVNGKFYAVAPNEDGKYGDKVTITQNITTNDIYTATEQYKLKKNAEYIWGTSTTNRYVFNN